MGKANNLHSRIVEIFKKYSRVGGGDTDGNIYYSYMEYHYYDQVATEIEQLVNIGEEKIKQLAVIYKNGDSLTVATICDEVLDKSGKLLGEVRTKYREMEGIIKSE
mgnify:CR=1 FL=1